MSYKNDRFPFRLRDFFGRNVSLDRIVHRQVITPSRPQNLVFTAICLFSSSHIPVLRCNEQSLFYRHVEVIIHHLCWRMLKCEASVLGSGGLWFLGFCFSPKFGVRTWDSTVNYKQWCCDGVPINILVIFYLHGFFQYRREIFSIEKWRSKSMIPQFD